MVGIVSKDIQDRIPLVPARATLHARTGAEVARKAHSPAGMISKTIEFDMNIDLPNPLRSTNFIPTELPSGRSFNHPHWLSAIAGMVETDRNIFIRRQTVTRLSGRACICRTLRFAAAAREPH